MKPRKLQLPQGTKPMHDVASSYLNEPQLPPGSLREDHIASCDDDYSSSDDNDILLDNDDFPEPIFGHQNRIPKQKRTQYVEDEAIGRIGDILNSRNVFEHKSFGKEAEILQRENAKKQSDRHAGIHNKMQQEYSNIQQMYDMLERIPSHKTKEIKEIKAEQMKSMQRYESLKQRLAHSSDDEDTDSSTDSDDPFANSNHFNALDMNDTEREVAYTKQQRNRRNYNKAKIRRNTHNDNSNILNKIKKGNDGRKKKKEKELILKEPSKMEAVTFSNMTRDTVCIHWNPPQHDGFDLLQRYQMQLLSNTTEWKTIYDDTVDNGDKYVLESLLSGSVYYLRARCSNSVGFSKWSNKTEFKTLGERIVMSRDEEIQHIKHAIKDNKEKERIAMDKKKMERKRKKKQKKLKKKQEKDFEMAKKQQKAEDEWKQMIREQELKDAEYARRLQYEEMLEGVEDDDEEKDSMHGIMNRIKEEENKARFMNVKKKRKHRKHKKKHKDKKKEESDEFEPTVGATFEDVRRENQVPTQTEQPEYGPVRSRVYKGNRVKNESKHIQHNVSLYKSQNMKMSIEMELQRRVMDKIAKEENKARLERQKMKIQVNVKKKRKQKYKHKDKPKVDANEQRKNDGALKPTVGATFEDVRRENGICTKEPTNCSPPRHRQYEADNRSYISPNNGAHNEPNNTDNKRLQQHEYRNESKKITVEIDPDDPNWEQRIRDEIARKRQEKTKIKTSPKPHNIQSTHMHQIKDNNDGNRHHHNNMNNQAPPQSPHRNHNAMPPSNRYNPIPRGSHDQYNRNGSPSSKPQHYSSVVRGGHDRSYKSRRNNFDARGGYRGYGKHGRGRGKRQKRPAPPPRPPTQNSPSQHRYPPGLSRVNHDHRVNVADDQSSSGSYSEPDDMRYCGRTPGGPVIPEKTH